MSEMRLRDDASVKKFHKVSDGTTYRAIPLFPSAHRSNVFYAQKCRKAGLRKTSPFADSFELVFVHNHPYRWSNLYSVETDERYTCLNLKPDASSSLWVAKPKPLTTAPRRQKRVWNCSLPVNALRSRRCDTTPPFDKTSRALVGKIDIRKLEEYPQNHPDAYSFSGGLCRGNRGIMEFVEMFKAPIKMLHPLLTATQEKNFNGTEAIPAMPFEGIILAHSNESEWAAFKNDKKHEAFIDRIVIIKVPYCLRVTEETNIYGKLLNSSSLTKAPCAPGTLDLLAQFSVMTRLIEPQNSNVYSKMRVYDGQNIRDTDPKAKPIQEYRDAAGINEGMEGISTRFAFKVLSKVFNFDKEEVAANPVHLMYVLENSIIAEQFDKERQDRYLGYLKGVLTDKYLEFVEKDIRKAFLESYGGLCQDTFNSYFHWADYWIRDEDYRDESTNVMLDRAELNAELEKIEKPAGISNPKEFRSEITNFVLRYKADHGGDFPSWTSYEKMRAVIEKKVLAATDELLPVISFAPKRSEEDQRKHAQFVETMVARGYTERQVRIIADWWQRMKKSS
jgi:serine protein kinase